MKHCLGLLLAMVIFGGWAQADSTFVQGPDLSGVWTAEGSPYILRGAFWISPRHTLTIESGVRVFFTGGSGLRVDSLGILNVLGAAGDSVVFTSDTLQFNRRWIGIQIQGSAEGCLFHYAVIEGSVYGGVRATGGNLAFSHCSFRDNHWWIELDDQDGGALKATNCHVSITDCEFAGNTAYNGGAISLSYGTGLLERCRIFGNQASGSGDGVYCRGGELTVTDCMIRDNGTLASGPGSGFYCRDASPILTGCVIADNLGHAGVACEWGSPSFNRCTITGSNGYYNTPNVFFNQSSAILNSCIIARSRNGAGVHFTSSENSQVLYSDIFGNAGGAFEFSDAAPAELGVLTRTNANGDSCDTYHNVYRDPMFVDTMNGDYHLAAGSPCIDAGDPSLPHDADGTVADIGAYMFVPDLNSNSGFVLPPSSFILEQNYPNPFNATTTIVFSLPTAASVDLKVFDVTGRQVRSLIGETHGSPLPAGEHRIVFDGSDLSSGVYFVRMQAGSRAKTAKMVLLK